MHALMRNYGCLQTFDELIQMAMKGDRRNVDILTNYLMPDIDQDDVYSAMADDRSLASFGKVLNNPDGKCNILFLLKFALY